MGILGEIIKKRLCSRLTITIVEKNLNEICFSIAKQFAFCGFTSLGYHGYLCFVTQFIDMVNYFSYVSLFISIFLS